MLPSELRGKKITVIITGSTGHSGWHFGQYEKRMAIVDDPAMDERSVEVTCLLKDRYRTRLAVPIEYLKPLQPSGIGDTVVVIGGNFIGTEGVINAIGDEEDMAEREWTLASTKDKKKIVCSETVNHLCVLARR
jgi:hypothetical protein